MNASLAEDICLIIDLGMYNMLEESIMAGRYHYNLDILEQRFAKVIKTPLVDGYKFLILDRNAFVIRYLVQEGGASSREFQNEISYLKRLKVDLEKDLALERSRATMTESEKLKSLREEIDKKKKRIADLEISVKQAVRVWEGSKEALRDIHFALGTKNLQEVIVEMGGNSLKELSRRAKEGKAAGEDWSDISIQFNKPEIKKAWTDLGITYKDAYSKPLNKTGQIVINNVSNHNFVETVAEQYLSLHLGSQVEYVGFDERLVVLKDNLVSGGVRFNALKAKISSGKAIKKLTINVLKITDDTYNLNIKYSPVSSTNPVSSINIAADNFAPINDTDLELVNATPPADSNRWIKIGRLTVDESTAKAQYQLEAEEIGTINFINGFKDVKYDNSAKTITLVYNGSVLDSLVLTGVKAKEKVPADKLGGTKQLVINLTGDDARFERLRNKLILAPLEIGCKIELIKGSTLSVSGENLVITKDSFEDLGVKVTQKPVASYLNKLYNDLQPYLTTGSGVGAEYTAEEVEPNVKVLVTRLDAEKASYASSEALTERIIPDLAKDPSTSEVPPLAMSAQGVTDTYYDTNLPPRGSCIMTKSGDLVFDGIAEIVNPLSGSNSDATKAPSVPFLIKSIQNTILLLERNNKPSVAFPLIGGELFLNCFTDLTGTKDAKQQELAEAIIISAIKQRSKDDLVLKFLDYKGNAFQRV
ncbi:10331_t:CDS:2 [Funneliformis geosporum]|nr:10331_t:CDS:2 [Funneliformis geosporum]